MQRRRAGGRARPPGTGRRSAGVNASVRRSSSETFPDFSGKEQKYLGGKQQVGGGAVRSEKTKATNQKDMTSLHAQL